MARRTAEQEVAHQIKKLADMGVTMRVHHSAIPSEFTPIMHNLADAATAAGINEDTKENK